MVLLVDPTSSAIVISCVSLSLMKLDMNLYVKTYD